MGKRLTIHPQTEPNTPLQYVHYLRHILENISEVTEVLLCGLKDSDSERNYTGISISKSPLPQDLALTAIALRIDPDDDDTFERVSQRIQSAFENDGISGPVIFHVSKFQDIWSRLKKVKAFLAYKRREPIILDSYHDLSTNLYHSIDRYPSVWNGIASYWFKWRTKEIIDIMKSDSSGRLHIHVSPNTNLVELAKRLLILSDAITFWYAGPIPSLTITNIPSPHIETDIGDAKLSLTGVSRPLPPSFGHLLTYGKRAFLNGNLFYSPLALIHAPPYQKENTELTLKGLSEWVKNFDHNRAPVRDNFVKEIIDAYGIERWQKIQKRSSEFELGQIINGWQNTLHKGKYLTLEEETWPLDKLLQWQADITEFCQSPSSYSNYSSNLVDPGVWLNIDIPYLENVSLDALLLIQEEYKSEFDTFRNYITDAYTEAKRDGTEECARRLTRKLNSESQRLTALYQRLKRSKRYGIMDAFIRNFSLGLVLYATGGAYSSIFGTAVSSIFDGLRERGKQRNESDDFHSQKSIFLWRLSQNK